MSSPLFGEMLKELVRVDRERMSNKLRLNLVIVLLFVIVLGSFSVFLVWSLGWGL